MNPSVSAVIATIGRPSLSRAVQSVLDQTYPVDEIIVVADAGVQVSVPADDRIVLLRCSDGGGPAESRQLGIDAARGSVIALLDDDDVWLPTKLARQLAAADSVDGDHWIVSSRMLRSEEHTSELQSRQYLVCRLLLEKKKKIKDM